MSSQVYHFHIRDEGLTCYLARISNDVLHMSKHMVTYVEPFRTAYDVSLNDDSWSQDMFNLVSDSTSKTWERLDV